MKISYQWLRELLPDLPLPETVADLLTMSGTEVEEMGPALPHLRGSVIVAVTAVERLAGSDHLSRVTIHDGSQETRLICGAPNVAVGQHALWFPPGAELADGTVMGTKPIAGYDSPGMLASAREAGLGLDQSGILVLPEQIPLGLDAATVLLDNDIVMDLKVTPNRGDCFSILGLARELAVLTGQRIQMPSVRLSHEVGDEPFLIELADPEDCPRYTGRVIRGVTVGESPWAVVRRLLVCGMRPINNIVDVTNYINLFYGQPLHAFDLDRLPEQRILVRRASQSEKIAALDERDYALTPEIMLITTGRDAVAVAGVIGGKGSEVHSGTRNLLLESAYFTPARVRRGAKLLGLSTESSQRFERGIDWAGTADVSDRASEMILNLAGGTLASGLLDVYPKPLSRKPVEVRPRRLTALLGMDVPDARCREIVTGLGCGVAERPNEPEGPVWDVTPPSWRHDLAIPEDFAEEVGRIVGYDALPEAVSLKGPMPTPINPENPWRARVEATLRRFGCSSILHHGLTHPELGRQFLDGKEPLRLSNPISEELSALIPSLAIPVLNTVAWNRNRQVGSVRVYDYGRVFLAAPGETDTGVREPRRVALALCGERHPLHFDLPKGRVDFYDLKGIVEALLHTLEIEDATLQPGGPAWLVPKESVTITLPDGKSIGWMGRVQARVCELFDLKDQVWLCEIELESLLDRPILPEQYKGIPRYPSVQRDLALVLPVAVTSDEVRAVIRSAAPSELEEVTLFDRFIGPGLEPGTKSLAFALRFRAGDRTLSDPEVDAMIAGILSSLETALNIRLRG